MGHHGVAMRESMRNKKVIGHLEKSIYSGGFVVAARCPSTDFTQGRNYGLVGAKKKFRASLGGPICELIGTSRNFITYFLDAKYFTSHIGFN